jgi:tetratricopeptide (TPR) repeat protein
MLLDFGVASTQGVGRLTKTGSQVGSLPYMSPEQILEQTEGLDARTDVYALGVTLYEMLTLRLPFLAQGVEATRRSILEGRCRPPHELNSAVAWDVETVCLKALDHERDARYDTAQAFADDLGRVLTLRPIAARRPGPALRTRRWLQRNPLRAAVVALAFLLIVVAPSIVAWMARQQRDALAIAENDARTQAEAATRIADFMIGIFGDVDPFGEAPVDLTVRAALDRALPRLREDLADQPQIQARLLHEVGQIYVNLGLADDAKELIDQALELYRTHLPDDEKQIAEILLDQGWVLTKQGQFQRALTVLEEARQIATRRQWLAPAAVESAGLSPEVLLTFRSELHARLGDALFNLRRYEDAENSLLQAIEAAEAAPVPIRGRDLSYVMMGTLCLDTDRTSEGVHWLEKALHYQREQHPGGSFNEARVQGRLAFLLWRNDRFPEAEQHFDEARAMSLKLVSGPHPTVAEILHNQASMYYEWRQLARAEQAFREALDIHLEIQGPQGPSTLLCQMALATTLLDLGEVEEAMELAEKNRDILCSPREHHFMAAPTNHLHFGQCLLAQHQYRDAEVELKKAREALIQAGSGPGHAIVEFHLGRLFQELGQPETALQHFERSRDRTRQHRPDDNWQVSRAIGAIGECLQELGQPDEAETKMLEAHHLLERTVGLAAPETVYLSQALAQLYEDQDRLEDAETYWDLFDTGRDSLGVDPR